MQRVIMMFDDRRRRRHADDNSNLSQRGSRSHTKSKQQ
jgi:hypothetical protein